MKRLWLAARLRRGDCGVVWHPCACSSIHAVPATEECTDTTGQCVRSNKADLPANFPKHVQVTVKAKADVEAPFSLQEHQTDSHRMSIENETLKSEEENTEQKIKKPNNSPERFETKEPFSENKENPAVQSPDPEQLYQRLNVPISAEDTPDEPTESGQGSSTKPKLKKLRDKKKSIEYICAKYGKSFCRPTELLKYQRTCIGDNSDIFNELGKYFKRFPSTDQKTDIQVKLSPCVEKENILNNPPSLQICQQENTEEQGKPIPSTNNEGHASRSPLLVPHQDTNANFAESGKSIDGLSLQRQHEQHRQKQYPCMKCEKSYNDLSALKKHHDKHTGKRYSCTECEKSFGDLSTLKRHHDKHIGKRYPCAECGKTYSRISCLNRHKIKHTNSRPETDVTSNLSLQGHHDKHRRKRYHPCTKCEKSFSGLSALRRHNEKHTGKRYPCTECEKSFTDLSALRKHHEKHTGTRYLCTDCEKSFCNLSTLKRHSEKHIGKRYPCTECGKTYSRNSCLTKHKIVHTVNKPHPSTRRRSDFNTNLNLTD
ncbi:hypothetical protein NDU88_000121 [Pleurodeles waltl]|uniref:C2H2-type domain-containing protein n=1 Tax=Pleurodeles waltl TaxID=8319 RepID=A0AAV7SVG1_PLEWA|nr:hypothetical protein NDU88_000121 [Pleurodeles waltl]